MQKQHWNPDHVRLKLLNNWTAEDMEQNVKLFLKSRYLRRSVRDLIDNDIKLLRQLKGDPCVHIASPQPKISEAPSKIKIDNDGTPRD